MQGVLALGLLHAIPATSPTDSSSDTNSGRAGAGGLSPSGDAQVVPLPLVSAAGVGKDAGFAD